MTENEIKTTFNGLAVPNRPIIVDNSKIYGVLYDPKQEASLMQGEGTISEYIDHLVVIEYIDHLVTTEQFLKNGGTISDDDVIWHLPNRIHSFKNNATLHQITAHLVKGMVSTQKYEFDDFIVATEGELDKEDPRLVISKNLVDRYTNLNNN